MEHLSEQIGESRNDVDAASETNSSKILSSRLRNALLKAALDLVA